MQVAKWPWIQVQNVVIHYVHVAVYWRACGHVLTCMLLCILVHMADINEYMADIHMYLADTHMHVAKYLRAMACVSMW
jgi:hypothetical protein